MENQPIRPQSEAAADATIPSNALLLPFAPVAVHRMPGPYGQFLDLTPNVFTSPNPEFMVRLVTDAVTHQAYVRGVFGVEYKNFENHVRGKHKSSAFTLDVFSKISGLDLSVIRELEGLSPDGPLLEPLLKIFQAIESIPSILATRLNETVVRCPCCGHNVLDDSNHWWSAHGGGIGSSEYAFAERLLQSLLIVCYLELLRHVPKSISVSRVDSLLLLSNPDRHPIGNWLAIAQKNHRVSSLRELEKALLGAPAADSVVFRYSRIKKWSSGQDVMPLEAASKIAKVSAMSVQGESLFLKARALALITEFVEASLPESAGERRMLARTIVRERLKKIDSNYRLIRNHWIGILEGKLRNLNSTGMKQSPNEKAPG